MKKLINEQLENYNDAILQWWMYHNGSDQLTSTGNIVIDKDTEIQELGQEGVNKYLGVDKSDGIQHSKMNEKIKEKRVRLILRISSMEETR